MHVTTLKLPDGLKRHIASLAKKAGKSPHAWMIDALREEAERAQRDEQLIADSLEAAANIDAGGPLYAAEDVHDYVVALAGGRKTRRPKPIIR